MEGEGGGLGLLSTIKTLWAHFWGVSCQTSLFKVYGESRLGELRLKLTDWLGAGPAVGRAPKWRCSRSSIGPAFGC